MRRGLQKPGQLGKTNRDAKSGSKEAGKSNGSVTFFATAASKHGCDSTGMKTIGSVLLSLLLSIGLGPPARAQMFRVLHDSTGSPSDGNGPFAGLVRDGAGNLYGTTVWGGAAARG